MMEEYNDIVYTIRSQIAGTVREDKDDKLACMELIMWAENLEIDGKGRWNVDSIRWDVISWIKENMGFRKNCPKCLEDDNEYIDYVERRTLPDLTIVKCKKCNTQHSY